MATIPVVADREREFRDLEARYRTLIEQIPAIVYIWETTRRIEKVAELYVSPQIEAITGFAAHEWMEDPGLWFDRLHPDDRDLVLDETRGSLEAGKAFRMEYRMVAKDGSIVWLDDHASPLRMDPRGEVTRYLGVQLDITARRRAEDDHRRGREQVRRQKAALAVQEGELVARQAAVIATVSHEFRTPLTVIAGVARTLEERGMVAPEALPLLAGLSDAARRLTELVNVVGAVLDDPRSGTFVRTETIFLREICANVLTRLGIRDARSRVTIEIASEAEFFVSDRELLSQLLYHVVDNAVKFSPETERVEIVAHRSGNRLLVRVLDRGAGIDRRLLESPDLFKQADQSSTRIHQGLGLGLVAASRLAEVLGGSIRYEHRAGGGTKTTLDLEAPIAG